MAQGNRKPPDDILKGYLALIAEWSSNGYRLPDEAGPVLVNELIVDFMTRKVIPHYKRPDGSPTSELGEHRLSLRPLQDLFGGIRAEDFTPSKLRAVRQQFVEQDLTRAIVNQRTRRIVKMFQWAVSHELVPVTVHTTLATVEPLPKNRGHAKEGKKIDPVDEAVVEATLPHLPDTIAAMVRLQLKTGMRSGELCLMRTADIDRTGEVWWYAPATHKTAYRDLSRKVPIGPAGQGILKPFLRDHEPEAYLFSPRRDHEDRSAERRSRRKTRVQPSQQNRRKKQPKRTPGERYNPESYSKRIASVIVRANQKITTENLGRADAGRMPLIPHWFPHQLRHTCGTLARKAGGLEGAQVVLGHRNAKITEVYAERDEELAAEVARKIG